MLPLYQLKVLWLFSNINKTFSFLNIYILAFCLFFGRLSMENRQKTGGDTAKGHRLHYSHVAYGHLHSQRAKPAPNKAFSPKQLLLTKYFLFLDQNPDRSSVSEILRAACLAQCHLQNLLKTLSSTF